MLLGTHGRYKYENIDRKHTDDAVAVSTLELEVDPLCWCLALPHKVMIQKRKRDGRIDKPGIVACSWHSESGHCFIFNLMRCRADSHGFVIEFGF